MGGGNGHGSEKLGADLMAKAARAAVYADDDLVLTDAERFSDGGFMDLGYALNFEVMITGA